MRRRRYLNLLFIPFGMFILVLFLRADSDDPTNLTIERAGDFVQLQSSTGNDVLVPLADVDDGAGLMSASQAALLEQLPHFQASTVEKSAEIQFSSFDWHETGLTIPDSTWVLVSVSSGQSAPFQFVLRDDLLALEATSGATSTSAVMKFNVDGQHLCSLGQATESLSLACARNTPDLVVSVAAVE